MSRININNMINKQRFIKILIYYFLLFTTIYEIITLIVDIQLTNETYILNPIDRIFINIILRHDIDLFNISEIIVFLFSI